MNRGIRTILSARRTLAGLSTRSWTQTPMQSISATRSAHSETSGGSQSQHKPERDPHSSEPASFSKEFEEHIPSNKARPTLSEAYQHSGADAKHPKRPAKGDLSAEDSQKLHQQEEDVKKHNEDIEQRYDRAISQLSESGEVGTLETEVNEKGHVKGE